MRGAKAKVLRATARKVTTVHGGRRSFTSKTSNWQTRLLAALKVNANQNVYHDVGTLFYPEGSYRRIYQDYKVRVRCGKLRDPRVGRGTNVRL